MVFHLDLEKAPLPLQTFALNEAEKVGKHAYEMPFPHYILAVGSSSRLLVEPQDEPGSWRSKRSTSTPYCELLEARFRLQLFTVDPKGAFHPTGPAHSSLDHIAEKGNGAFSHYRGTPSERDQRRFALPKAQDASFICYICHKT